MKQFPRFLRSSPNRVSTDSSSGGMEGYVYEGADGSQVVLWTCPEGGTSPAHTHAYDEYAIVVEGAFTGTVGGEAVHLSAGDECYIPAGVEHDGVYSAGYRAIDGFAGTRVKREQRRASRG